MKGLPLGSTRAVGRLLGTGTLGRCGGLPHRVRPPLVANRPMKCPSSSRGPSPHGHSSTEALWNGSLRRRAFPFKGSIGCCGTSDSMCRSFALRRTTSPRRFDLLRASLCSTPCERCSAPAPRLPELVGSRLTVGTRRWVTRSHLRRVWLTRSVDRSSSRSSCRFLRTSPSTPLSHNSQRWPRPSPANAGSLGRWRKHSAQ